MSVRVVARVRPLLRSERDVDVILHTGSKQGKAERKSSQNTPRLTALRDRDTLVRIPNPKNENEEYSFQFNAVYDAEVSQQELFEAEVSPTIKHLFNGFDVTLFAYGVTGTGKTHTMRGGKSLAERGVIPRLLSAIYRRSRKIEKDSGGQTSVNVCLSYYEIYNDKVFDLFEPSDKRTIAGLPLRDNGGKTVVVGLTEKPCCSLKEFEILYDHANINRSTSATKLNAHSSRSHAILCVKVAITTGDKTCISTASAIDLAGSEDNRRTDNDKERMVESASINKSLFVLAQCVEAITKKHQRIPYRESKMTRILSLGQNNGLTVMILNLAPVRSYHLDTISSLNFANRTKKIELREVENEHIFKGPPRPVPRSSAASSMRQPLRPLTSSVNLNLAASNKDPAKSCDAKPVKAFHVYSDKRNSAMFKKPEAPNRSSLGSDPLGARSSKSSRVGQPVNPNQKHQEDVSTKIEEIVEKKVEEILAVRAVSEKSRQSQVCELNEQVQRRLDHLEKRIEGSGDARAEGLSYLLMAKQHQSRGEDTSALKMFELALPFFPQNEKLAAKIATLKMRIQGGSRMRIPALETKTGLCCMLSLPSRKGVKRPPETLDADYKDFETASSDEDPEGMTCSQRKKRTKTKQTMNHDISLGSAGDNSSTTPSPRTIHLLSIINSRDVSQIKLLKGVGVKKAEAIVECLCEMDQNLGNCETETQFRISSLAELSQLKGVGVKSVQSMRHGVLV
ncbi:kinesin family protein [Aspergillus lucknowensis]|uniref:P-loop containing nucleoside triphosphate hydrolase protein n=1 Tax=Aspergillus lucknowensis TaxID=176173 RepID=A0ABR4LLW8_9EURO